MYRKLGLLVLVFMFLFTGLAYAVCSKYVCIVEPGANDVLTPGSVSYVVTTSGAALPSNANISREKLAYKCSDDSDWTTITIRSCNAISGCPSEYPWEVPFTTRKGCQMNVTILDGNGNKLAGDSSGTFAIGGGYVRIVQPNGGEKLTSGQTYNIVWTTDISNTAKSVLAYSCDATTWTKIVALPDSPLNYLWTVPAESSDTCKVRVTLKDSAGTVLKADKSDNNFSIH